MGPVDGAHATLAVSVDASGTRVIRIEGELDLSNVPAIEAELASLVAGATSPITFDFAALTFMDSSAIAMLLRLANETGPITIRNPSRSAQLIIQATGLADVLRIAT